MRSHSWLIRLAVIITSALLVNLNAQSFSSLVTFDGTNGEYPNSSPLVQGTDGNLYGTTEFGEANGNYGTIFRITPDGTLTTIYSFCAQTKCMDGASPQGGLLLGNDGNFYGTTWVGGHGNCGYATPGCGTIFRVTPTGMLKTLYRFCLQKKCPDGGNPNGSLVFGTDGSLYGTTYSGGNPSCGGCGTVFRLDSNAQLTSLHLFDLANGGYPVAGLLQGFDGKFYGTTWI